MAGTRTTPAASDQRPGSPDIAPTLPACPRAAARSSTSLPPGCRQEIPPIDPAIFAHTGRGPRTCPAGSHGQVA
jgi:hypothetical protein